MVCRNGRVLRSELLESAEPQLAKANLRDLVRINRWFGGHAVLRRLFGLLVKPAEEFSVLDIGAASADAGACLQRHFPAARVTSLDLRSEHLRGAAAPKLAGDAFRLPFRAESFDFVFCALLLHHFTNDEISRLLHHFYQTARQALVVVDLERHPLAYYFLPATQWVCHWSDITVHDGAASVEAGFKASELQARAGEAGLRNCVIRVHRPWFRVSLVARR